MTKVTKGYRSETRRRASLPSRHISQRLWLPGGFFRLLTPRGWVARTELERVLFPLEKAKAQASLEPKSRGPSTQRRRIVSGGFSYGIALNSSYVQILPGQGYQTTPRFAPVTLGRPSSPGETRRPTPRFASATLGYPSCLSETWRRRRHVS